MAHALRFAQKNLSILNKNCFPSNGMRAPCYARFYSAMDFNFNEKYYSMDGGKNFETYVDSKLFNRSEKIGKFNIKICELKTVAYLDKWISCAVERNVEYISIVYQFLERKNIFELPKCLFTCKTLKKMNFSFGYNILKFPNTIYLPMLQALMLNEVYLSDDDSTAKFFSECPRLKHLWLIDCAIYHLRSLNISNLNLKSLIIFNLYGIEHTEINIHTPALKYLTWVGYIEERGTLQRNCTFDMASLEKVYLSFKGINEFSDLTSKLIKGFSNTKHLTFRDICVVDLIYFATCLPASWPRLKFLNIDFHCHSDTHVLSLAEILKTCPSLECLRLNINNEPRLVNNELDIERLSSSVILADNLEEIYIFSSCLENMINVAKVFIENGRVLKRIGIMGMFIGKTYSKCLKEIAELLNSFKKASAYTAIRVSLGDDHITMLPPNVEEICSE